MAFHPWCCAFFDPSLDNRPKAESLAGAAPSRCGKGPGRGMPGPMSIVPLSLRRFGELRRCPEALVEIGQDIVDMFEPDREPDIAFRHAGGQLFRRIELGMGRRCRVDREAARVADIGDMIEQLEGIDEFPSGFAAALEFETDQPTVATLEIGVGPPALFP